MALFEDSHRRSGSTNCGFTGNLALVWLRRLVDEAAGKSGQLKTAHGSRTGLESVHGQAELLQDADVHIGQRVVVLLVKGQVLTMSKVSASQQHRHVAVTVIAGVAKITRQQNRGLVKE